ncbi:hypothetical protein LJC04_06075 [Ruminococcaceae bacterium OttesenSCG-928-O06]|nr:hypothetical protein [Ruminococcaceae bacterium OttesenSCG-928-O06]
MVQLVSIKAIAAAFSESAALLEQDDCIALIESAIEYTNELPPISMNGKQYYMKQRKIKNVEATTKP